jgi:hypothetical protein
MSGVHRQQCLSHGQSSQCYNRLQIRCVPKRINAAALRESNGCECTGRNAMPCLAEDEDGSSAADTERRQKQKVVDPVLAALGLSHSHMQPTLISFHIARQTCSEYRRSVSMNIHNSAEEDLPLLLFYCTLSVTVNYIKPFVILLVVKIHFKNYK